MSRYLIGGNIVRGVPRLPSEYQEVEYLESHGTEYINTTYKPNSYSGLDLNFVLLTTNNNNCFMAVIDQSSNVKGFGFSIWDLHAFANYGPFTQGGRVDINTEYVYEQEMGVAYLNGVLMMNMVGLQDVAPLDFPLFAGNRNGSIVYNAIMRIMSTTLTENSIKVRDFVPCYRKSDNKPGMYDLAGSICPLTNTPFYINAGTGEFVVGPDHDVILPDSSMNNFEAKIGTNKYKIYG